LGLQRVSRFLPVMHSQPSQRRTTKCRATLITCSILLIFGTCFSQDMGTTGTERGAVFSTDPDGAAPGLPDARVTLSNPVSRERGSNEQGANIFESRVQERKPPRGQNGIWDFSIWTGGATSDGKTNSFAEARIRTAGVFLGKVIAGEMGRGWARGNLEYGINLIPVFVASVDRKVRGGGGFEPVVLRWNSSHNIGRAVPYMELAGGGIFTATNLPPGNTSSVNFTVRLGEGVYILTKDRQSLDIGCRWSHISNANLGVTNPTFNGLQITLGYHWFKSRASRRFEQ